MQSKAATVDEYLAALPEERRTALEAVRKTVRANLDRDYEEGMQYGMIGWYVPHRVFPPGYHCDPRQPLPFAGLASQKQYMSLYLMSVYMDSTQADAFRAAWKKTGKKLDMGKSCIRFKKLEDLALDVVGKAIKAMPAKKWIACFQETLALNEARKAAGRAEPGEKARPAAKAKAKAKAKPTANAKRRMSK